MADLKNIMEAAQRMQEGIKEAQDKLKQERVDVNVGANAVKLTMPVCSTGAQVRRFSRVLANASNSSAGRMPILHSG